MTDARRIIEPQSHEFSANLTYNKRGLSPWFAADSVVKENDGSLSLEGVDLDLDGFENTVDITLWVRDGGSLLPPINGETPAGTTVKHETIREFQINVEVNDGLGVKRASFHLSPRWANLKGERRDGTITDQNVPESLANDHTDAVNVSAKGSNIPFDQYPDLLQEVAGKLGINPDYFSEYHETSNFQDAARHVRILEDSAGPIHAPAGPLVQLAFVMQNDRTGYRKLTQNDLDKRGKTKPGFYHTVTLGPDRIRRLWPNHNLPKEIKHYYKDDYHDRPKSDPLRHPKLEVAYQVSRSNETLHYNDDNIQQLERELDEALYSVLAEAGIDLRGGDGSPYVADNHFTAENAMTDASIVSLDLTQIKHEQESVVMKHLGDGFSPIQDFTQRYLATDGGEVSPEDIATDGGFHIDSVYRALGKMEDLIEREYGKVSLKSTYVAELVTDRLQTARDELTKATNATAEALEAADRGLDEKTSAFVAWCESHDVNFREGDESVSLNLGKIEAESQQQASRKVAELLREGLKLWESMNRDPIKFRLGRYNAHTYAPTTGSKLRSTSEDGTKRVGFAGEVWRKLRH